MAYVFLVTNNVTQQQYVGCTIRPPYKRWKTLLWGNRKRPLAVAVREYGFESFTKEVIEECEDHERFDRAQFWITQLGTIIPNGYNSRPYDKYNLAKTRKRNQQ